MAASLGAELRLGGENFSTCFESPNDSSKKVHVMLDACHIIKPIRNSLATVSHLIDADGQSVKWAYIQALDALQREEGLRLGNKLTKTHIQWPKQKMKVRLAVQTLSASVADALDFCEQVLKLPHFRGAGATAKFVRLFEHLFNILNSRSPFAKSYKAPLRAQNESCWRKFFCEARAYIKALKEPTGRLVLEGVKKTAFLGFLLCTQSTENIFEELVHRGPLKSLPTRRLSQDHAETLFWLLKTAHQDQDVWANRTVDRSKGGLVEGQDDV